VSTDQELLDEVDAFDQTLGPRTRGEIHRQGLRHRAVHILVFNAHGQLFLQKRSMSKDVNPGAWDTSAAGHVDTGEAYHAAACREVEEELGIPAPGALEPICQLSACEETGMEFIRVFVLRHEGPFTLHSTEIDEGGWFDPAAIDQWIAAGGGNLTRSFILIWNRFRADFRESSP